MTQSENLYVVAMEECAEVAQALSKILRFGEEHQYVNAKDHNAEEFLTEYYQLQAVVEMIIELGQIEGRLKDFSPERIESIKGHKKENVRYYAGVSRALGKIDKLKLTINQSEGESTCLDIKGG